MTDTPEFPQADPAMQYIAREVAKLEEVAYCSTGYYKMQKEHRERQQKLIEVINLLRHEIKARDDFTNMVTDNIIKADQEASKRLNEHLKSLREAVLFFEANLNKITKNAEVRMDAHIFHMTKEIDTCLKEIRDAAKHPGEVYAYELEKTHKSLINLIQNLTVMAGLAGIAIGLLLGFLIFGGW